MTKFLITREQVEQRLASFGIDPSVLSRYDEPHRFYHNFDHVLDILNQMAFNGDWGEDVLFLAAVFHDIVYDPRDSQMNEVRSKNLFVQSIDIEKYEVTSLLVGQLIMDTQHHTPSSPLSIRFIEYDLNILSSSLLELIEFEHKIFKEFQFVPYLKYKSARLDVLNRFIKYDRDHKKYPNLRHLIEYVTHFRPKIGVYAGSFNPFHKGHYNILEKAEEIFDKVIIFRGVNPDKKKDVHEWQLPNTLKYREIWTQSGLLTTFFKEKLHGLDVTLVRGLRNSTDLQYEMTQYRYLKDLYPKIKVVSLFCDPEFEHISSSGIKTLHPFGEAGKYLLD